MKRSVKSETKRDQFAELSEGMGALAEARQGKRTLQTHSVESGASIKKSEDLKVFISLRDSKCDECGEELGRKAWITLEENKGALCLACADLDELVFLPSGGAALTRRARKHSVLSAVVLKFSKARGRYERQGLLVEERALDEAEAECLADAEARERRAARQRERQAELDQNYLKQFAKRIRELFPACPAGRELQIAEHACRKYSGRIGRSAAAKSFDEGAVRLAMAAHIRHRETNYDELLAAEWDRADARAQVKHRVDELLRRWQRRVQDS
jgi:RNase P subunit RPR2